MVPSVLGAAQLTAQDDEAEPATEPHGEHVPALPAAGIEGGAHQRRLKVIALKLVSADQIPTNSNPSTASSTRLSPKILTASSTIQCIACQQRVTGKFFLSHHSLLELIQ